MLLDQDSRRQRLDRIVVEHRDGCLKDDGPRVKLSVDEVDGRAANAHAVFERLPLRIESRE